MYVVQNHVEKLKSCDTKLKMIRVKKKIVGPNGNGPDSRKQKVTKKKTKQLSIVKSKNQIPKKKESSLKVIMKKKNNVIRLHCPQELPLPKTNLKNMLKDVEIGRKHTTPVTLAQITQSKSDKPCTVRVINYDMPSPMNDVVAYSDDGSDLGSEVESEMEEESFVEKKVGEYLLYEIPNGAILLLHGNSKIFMHGIMQVNVLHGAVNIFGKYLDKLSPANMVYSPRGSAYLSIENCNIEENPNEESIRKSLKQQLLMLGLNEQTIREVTMFKLKSNTVLMHCKNTIDKASEYLMENLAGQIYPKILNGLRCTFYNKTSLEWKGLDYNPEWTPLINLLDENSSGRCRLLLTGGKGVGKSTLLRFLVNKSLNSSLFIYVLDLDPGQPEFTVPGAISLVKVSTPLLGPNYTHLQSTIVSIFVPNINISADHESYLDAVKKIAPFVPKDASVIVNYMGFTKGIGIYLTAAIVQSIRPDVVVQIESTHDARNFNVHLTPETMRTQLLLGDAAARHVIKDYKLIRIDSMTSNDVGWELEPRQVRDMCVLSYLSQALPPNCKFLTERDVNIFQASLDEVNIVCNNKLVGLQVANANLVALCLEDARTCVGWGVVRGYCEKTNQILLVTPITDEILEEVKNLVIGSVTLPRSFYLCQHDAVRGIVPYTFKGELTNFAKTPKRSIIPKQSRK